MDSPITNEFIPNLVYQSFLFFIFPNTKYKNIVNKRHASCSICLDLFKEESSISQLECNHIFHYNCILKWGEKGNSCPLCRESFEPYMLIYQPYDEENYDSEDYDSEDYDSEDSEDLGDYDLFSYNRSED